MKELEIEKLVAFVILMENGDGIKHKLPDYIAEKFQSCQYHESVDTLRNELDIINQNKFDTWCKRWRFDTKS